MPSLLTHLKWGLDDSIDLLVTADIRREDHWNGTKNWRTTLAPYKKLPPQKLKWKDYTSAHTVRRRVHGKTVSFIHRSFTTSIRSEMNAYDWLALDWGTRGGNRSRTSHYVMPARDFICMLGLPLAAKHVNENVLRCFILSIGSICSWYDKNHIKRLTSYSSVGVNEMNMIGFHMGGAHMLRRMSKRRWFTTESWGP